MKAKYKPAIFSGRDALAYQYGETAGDAAPSAHHVQKRNRADKGLEVVFDPIGYKSYVTGFHKRKAQRRKDAQEQIVVKEKRQRLEDRKVRREDLAKKLQLEKYPDPEVALAAAAKSLVGVSAVDVFDCDGVTTTVTTVAMNSDDEGPGAEASASDGDSSEEQIDTSRVSSASEAEHLSDSEDRMSDGEAKPLGSDERHPGGPDSAFPEVQVAAEGDDPLQPTSGQADSATNDALNGKGGSSGRIGRVIDRGIILRPSRSMKRQNRKRQTDKIAAKQGKGKQPSGAPPTEKPGSRRSAKGMTFNSSKRKRKGTAAGQARKGKGSDNKRKK